MAREKHVGRRPARINPLNEDLAGAGDARPLDPPPGPHAVSLTAGSLAYTQNFDALASSGATGTSLPADWTFSETGGAAPATYSVGTGSGTTGDTWSFGIAGTNPVTDRAFGSLASTTVTQILIGASFANMSGAAITAILVSYVGEQWRRGGNTGPDRLDFQISFNATSLTTGSWTDVNGLDFVSINASASALTLDGNAAANRLAISFNIAGVSVASGATFWIRWIDTNIAGNDDGLAIDNFSLTATVNRPPIVANAIPDRHGNEDEAILYTVPANSFSDPDGNPLIYTASLADNSPLPAWLVFTAATRTFSGTPPANFNGTLSVKVTASDGSLGVSDIFALVIDPVNDAAIIGGTDMGAVTEDGNLGASGHLTISDVDAGEASFEPVAAGTAGDNGYGIFEMLADGSWTYTLDNEDPGVQALHAVDTRADTLTILAADGTGHLLSVAIHGANEASAAPYARVDGEALVNSSVAGLQSQPSIAFLAGSRYVIVFQVFDGDQLDVRGRIFNRDGSPAAPDFSVNLIAGGEQHLPQVAALSDGGFVVVWQDSAGGTYDIRGRLYGADGSAGSEISIATALANETAPAVAGLPSGGFVALWIDDSDADGDVRARVFLADGSPAGDAFAVNAPAAGGQVHPAVAVLAGGTIVAVWEDGAAGDVRMRLFSAAGSALTAELTAYGSPAGSQGAPCVVALAGGGYAIAWMDFGADGDGYGIYARQFGADGDPAGAAFRVNTLAAGDQMLPSIAALPDGGFIVSWADGAGPDADDIRAQRFDADGVPVDAELVVNGHADGVQSQPAMAANIYGTLVVAWNDASSPGVGGDDDGAVVHALLTPGGAPPAGPTEAIIGGEDRGAVTEDTAPGTSGTLTVTDPDAGEARLVAQAGAAGSNGYGMFQVNADGTWTYSIAGSALADTLAGGETRTDSIVISSIDGTTHAVTIAITGTNDAPTVAIAPLGALAAIEQIALDLKGDISVADVDAGAVSVTARLAVGHGVLHLAAGGSGASVFDNDSASVTIAGTIAQINALLGGDATSVVTYTATGDAPPATTTLTVSIDDNAAAGSDSATIAITAVDDAPVVTATPGTTAYLESVDTAPGSIAVDDGLTLTDADDTALVGATVSISGNFQPGQDILAFDNDDAARFGNIAASYDAGSGVLILASAGGLSTLAQWQAALRAVTYSNGSEEPGQVTRTIGFTVDDGDLASAVATRSLSVAAQNDSPSGANSAVTIDEDETFTFTAAHFGFTDVDGDAFAGVRFGVAPAGGTLYFDAVAVAGFPTTIYSAADIAAGKLIFVPTLNLNGTGAASVGFTLVDDGGTAGAGQDADTTPNTLSFDIVSVNDQPSGADKEIGIDEDSAYTLTRADFGFSDIDGNAFEAVILSHPVSGGTLFIDGDPMTSATLVSVATIDAGGVVFVPAANASGALGGIAFRVRDDGGVDNGGQAADTTPNTLTFAMTPVNDAPVNGVPGAQAVDEDGSLVFSTANGNALSVVDVDATLLTVTLSVAHGTLMLASTAGLTFADGAGDATTTFAGTAAAINAALGAGLTYAPAADYNGGDTLAIATSDDGPLTAADTVAIAIDPVNDAPAGASIAFTVNEDSTFTFNAGHFGFTDAAEGNDFLGVVIATIPAAGTILRDGVAVVAGMFVGAGDIALGRLTFAPAPDAYGAPYGGFTFQVRDDGGTGNGGQDTDQSPDMIIFDVTALNDAPTNIVPPGALTIGEDDELTFSTANGNALSVADRDATTLTVMLSVAHGTLTLAGTAGLSFVDGSGTADASMTFSGTAAAIEAALGAGLTYNPAANFHGSDAILVVTTDNGQTGTGPVGTDSDSIAVGISPVNDAPSGTDRMVTGSEDEPYGFTAIDFGFSDPVEGNAFLAVRIGALPVAGTILLNGVAVMAGDFIAVSAIDAGMLTFQPDPDMSASPYATFTFQVQDDGGILNGGVDTDPVANTMTINVTPDNDPPVAVDDMLAATEDMPVTYTAGQIVGNDTDVEGDTRTIASVSGPTGGTAVLNGDGSVTFNPTPNFDGLAGFDYVVSDGNGGTDTGHVTINVTAVDDAPTAVDDAIPALEGALISGGALLANDADPDSPLSIFMVNGSAANVGRVITLASGSELRVLSDGSWGYRAIGSAFAATPDFFSGASNLYGYDSFTYTLAGGGTATVTVQIRGIDSADTLLGTAGDDALSGGVGADYLDGGGGADVLRGGTGDDAIIVDADDLVDEAVGGGYDNVAAKTSYVLGAGQEIEILSTSDNGGTAAISLNGNAFGQVLVGNAGANYLDGGGGADLFAGLGGNDAYIVDADDRVYESMGGGYDNVAAKVSYALLAGQEIEVLSTTDNGGTAAISLNGNELGQVLVGNAGANYLDGGGGADLFAGLGGNDAYIVDADDRVYESAGGGYDNVAAKVSYALQAGQEIEVLSTTDNGGMAAIDLTGNEYGQVLVGNAGANILDGGLGNDLLQGLGGADTFQFTTALGAGNVDTIVDFVSGTDKIALDDTVFTAIRGTLGADAFAIGTAAADADDRIIYNSATGQLFYDADGNGSGVQMLFATLHAGTSLAASDFQMI